MGPFLGGCVRSRIVELLVRGDGCLDSPIAKTLRVAVWGSLVISFLAICAAAAFAMHSLASGGALLFHAQ